LGYLTEISRLSADQKTVTGEDLLHTLSVPVKKRMKTVTEAVRNAKTKAKTTPMEKRAAHLPTVAG